MAAFRNDLSDDLARFIRKQPVYFTATAAARGRINLSPKGMDTFRVLSPTRVAYLDLTGSGNETAAHIANDGRLTVMFCSFDAKPLILRLYGRGSVVARSSAGWAELIPHFDLLPGARQIIVLDVESVQTSCGFAVPRMQLVDERPTLVEWAEKQGDAKVRAYQSKNNAKSIDGLTAPPVG